MASDDFDIDWDNDPFNGDIDFDMDFNQDPFAKKSFIASVGSGFLSGLVDETVGSGKARFRTMRTILPESFNIGLDKLSWVSDRIGELATEFKEENAESAKSLQNIASRLNKSMGQKLPDFIGNGLSSFSEKDFSSWEKADYSSSSSIGRVDSVTEEEVEQAQNLAGQSSMFAALGDSLNQMSVATTAALKSSIGVGNKQLVNIEGALRDMLQYQRTVDARLQQAQLNLLARSYVQEAKFFKFNEAAMHATVTELKKITKYTSLSDYEKTSTYTAGKAYMRSRIFNTIGARTGGITGLLRDRFSGANRKAGYGAVSELLGNVSDAMDMSDGGLSKGMIGNILGRMVAGVAVEKLPEFFSRGPGKKAIDKLAKAYPEQATYINEQIAKLTDVGNVLSYAATSGTGILNYMANNYQPMDEMKYVDYEDYLANLKPGQKPLPKAAWTALNAAGNKSKEAINKLMSDVNKTKGTQYVLKARNVKDLNQPGIWKEINNITLNEVLPGLISRTNQILEKLRTGNDDVEATSYNYMRGQFQTDSQRRISTQADLMPHAEFERYATASLNLVDSVDPDKMLSASARKAFALVIAKDIDAELGFNPYYYLGDIKGVSESAQKEIHAVLMKHFGITTSDVQTFNSSDSLQRMKQMTNMSTSEGKERLNKVSAAADSIKQNIPNIAERIDLLRSTGNEQMLRDLGIIYTENGIDRINTQAFHERLGKYMDNPNDPELRGTTFPDVKPGPTNPNWGNRGNPPTPPPAGGPDPVPPPAPPDVNPNSELTNTLSTLNERLRELISSPKGDSGATGSFDTMTGLVTEIRDSNQGIFDRLGDTNNILTTLMDLAKAGKLITGGTGDPTDEKEEERAKKRFFNKDFMDRIKGFFPGKLISSGMKSIISTNPMVLGGILGAFGSAAATNPMVGGALAAGGLLLGVMVNRFRKGGSSGEEGDQPSDDEDILDDKGEPLLKSIKLKAGEYLDAATKKVIKTWKDIRGPIYDAGSRTVIGVKELAGKIFGADGRAVALSGLRFVRDKLTAGYNILDPISRIKSIIETGKSLIYQQDIYVRSNPTEPALRAAKFKTGEYFIRDEAGNFKPISGWNEINGPVYDSEGNQLVSQSEYDEGLVTATGTVVRNLGNGAANLAGAGAGMARTGLNAILGKFGFAPKGDSGDGSTINGKDAGPNGVELRLDRIYRMLAQHFNLPMEVDTGLGGSAGGSTGGVETFGERLNSLAFKEKEAEKEKRDKVNDAIIEIAGNTRGLGEGDKDDEKKGFWGTIKGFLSGMGAFGMKLIKNPIGTIGSLIFGSMVNSVGRLAKIGSALFSGVLGITSPVYSLLKWGFTKVAAVLAGKRAMDELGGGDPDQFGQSGRRRRRRRRGRRGGRGGRGRLSGIANFAKGAALTYLGSEAVGALSDDDEEDFNNGTEDLEVGERDPATGRYKTWTDSAFDAVTSWLPQGMLAKNLMEGVAGKENASTLDNYGLFWSSDGKIFFNRQERDDHQAISEGKAVIPRSPDAVKANNQVSLQRKARLAMYGINDSESNLARRVMALEDSLYPYVVIKDNRATLKPDTPMGQLVDQFANSGVSKYNDKSTISTWVMARFKPIFMVFNAAVSVARMGDIREFDNARSYDVVQVVERVQQTVSELNPFPYTIDVRIDDKEAIMGPEQTRDAVAKLVEQLNKEFPAPTKTTETIATSAETKAKQEGTTTDSARPSAMVGMAEMAAQGALGGLAARASAQAAEREFKQPADVTTIDVSDMLPGKDQPMDAFTMTRLAVYGNIDNIAWRVETVLRLERYVENFIMVMGNDARFTGKTGQILELFRASFRINNPIGENNWMIWFRDRFLPTLMTYCKEIYKLSGGAPAGNWKKLSATNRAVIARLLVNQIVSVNDTQVPVWEIEASPFQGSKSGKWADRTDNYLKSLDAAAQEARLKDPELEDERSQAKAESKEIIQRAQAANVQQKTQSILNSVYKTGSVSGGSSSSPMAAGGGSVSQAGGYYPNATMSAPGGGAGSAGSFMGKADGNFNPEFIKQAGEDKGIKMSLAQGEQLMLNHLVKAGFRDNKTLALALAMARKETGGYQATVENTNWSAPTLLKYFRNIPDAATAQKVAAMSPAERAMWVYGRAPKGPKLGNQKPEDGWTYRGRGLFQLTGKSNYEAFKKATGIDVVSNPRLVSEDPNVMAESAVWYLKNNAAMKSIANTGDFETAVRGINGGNPVPATDERRQFYNDYLNRLRAGDLTLPDGGDDQSAQANDAAAVNTPTQPQVPEAADKNVPADKVVTPTGPNAVKELLNQAEKGSGSASAPTTAPPSTESASSLSPASASSSVSASSVSSEPLPPSKDGSKEPQKSSVESSSGSMSNTSAPTPAPVKQAPAAKEQPAPAPVVNMPDAMVTSDQGLAKIGVEQTRILTEIRDALKQARPGVRV